MSDRQSVSVEEYIQLRASVGWGSPPPGTVAHALAATLVWAVERNLEGHLIGMARAVGDGVYVLIVDVVVDPHCQARGLGRRLMESLLRDPVVAMARHTTLFAAPDVAGFYESLGMVPQSGTYFHT